MVELLYSCIDESSISSSDETAEEINRCFANEACAGDSGDILADQMISPTCNNGVSLSRSSSASSLVTCAQPIQSDKLSLDQQGASTDTNQEATESFGTRWTDDKHSSYLSSMEATFVKNLYDREYCALDICGHAPPHMDFEDPDCAESQPELAFEFTEFKSCQNGYWRPKILAKPSILSCSPFALFANPWVKRFRNQTSRKAHVRSQKENPSDFEEGEIAKPQKDGGVSLPQDTEGYVENVVEMWLERLHSHRFTSSSTPGVWNEKNCHNFPISTDIDRETSAPKQQCKRSACCKRFYTGSLLEECQDVDVKIRSSKAAFEERPFRKLKTIQKTKD